MSAGVVNDVSVLIAPTTSSFVVGVSVPIPTRPAYVPVLSIERAGLINRTLPPETVKPLVKVFWALMDTQPPLYILRVGLAVDESSQIFDWSVGAVVLNTNMLASEAGTERFSANKANNSCGVAYFVPAGSVDASRAII